MNGRIKKNGEKMSGLNPIWMESQQWEEEKRKVITLTTLEVLDCLLAYSEGRKDNLTFLDLDAQSMFDELKPYLTK